MRKEKWIFESKYLVFYFRWGFDISFEICGYFDDRPRINLDLFFFNLTLILPFHNKGWESECDCPKWGISYHSNMIWIHLGGKGNMNGGSKWYTIHMPWDRTWVRTSMLKKDGTWEDETRKNKKNIHRSEWDDQWYTEFHPYTYILKSGEVQNRTARVRVSEREWRMRWLVNVPLFRKIRRTIDVEFDDEVGERSGSWKGGTIGCGYDLKPNEDLIECLRRMEKERKFT